MDKEIYKVKKEMGEESFEEICLASINLFADAVAFMKKLGLLESFLMETKKIRGKVVHDFIEVILNIRGIE